MIRRRGRTVLRFLSVLFSIVILDRARKRGLGTVVVHGRQSHAEGRPPALALAFRDDRPLMQIDQMLNDRQADTDPSVPAGGGTVGLTKSIEDEGKKIGTNTLAGIGDRDLGVRIDRPQTNFDSAGVRGELNRVVKQIPHHLL